ncbi:hypothetical protein M670_04104 [Schinkia azotoformans MEV2011]|uniref:Uncharacterized protein n=2 Tax=Schinkia azotoformans TaxID=1454 RepID=K6DQA5_SCHAZ|nr:hypothetical protein [Schinkia azotoformans]EKN70484.1 hypothetical protein BAZO_01022 [Schinkia azotoformans LMG 9581]KEF36687.1 hypothetical protein M670_04104 [Schinkia azotoformans MEV2011]MEC1638961.1 hypothetical protein [Schinkia azotoformans]MEC1695394.1 hypothetical protein [Schinkia azotoformans]MEC1715072.1 hypothetical protein [Schinkia azotoformans]
MNLNENEREQEIKNLMEKDSKYEGRDRYFLDVDRMINEGMAGGTIINREDNPQIGEARSFEKEEPPLELE